jgi:hypothetical protein
MSVKNTVEHAIRMNNVSAVNAARRGAWSTVKQIFRISDAMLAAYERTIGAVRVR